MKTRVLCNFRPSNLDKGTIKTEILEAIINHGVELTLSVFRSMNIRTPEHCRRVLDDPDNEANSFHQDDYWGGDIFAVWSNIFPTEIKSRFDGERLSARDGDILLIYNWEVEHRAPQKYGERWFVRISNLKEL